MSYRKGQIHWAYYRESYNNPGQYRNKVLNSNDAIARAVVAGLCDRKADDEAGTMKFKQ